MLTIKEKAINNSFQIKEDLEDSRISRSFYYTPTKPRSRSSLRAQPPGRIKVFTKKEIQQEVKRRSKLWETL
jgi:hypothetical protein